MSVLHCKSAIAGVTVGNGGDAVRCEVSDNSSYAGYYSFDYLMTLREDNSDLQELATWGDQRERLLGLFEQKYPDLERFFRDFLARIPGEDAVPPEQIYLQERLWLEAIYGLVDLEDEQAIRKLPPNCYKKGAEKNHLEVLQAVIRQKNESATIYNYDPEVLRQLRYRPLQYSFLIVHEWLWDFVEDPEALRRINRFLHSAQAETLSKVDFQNSLKNLGLSLHPRKFVPVCQRTPGIQESIVLALKAPCELLTEGDLAAGMQGGRLETRGSILSGFFSSSWKDIERFYLEHYLESARQIEGPFVNAGLTTLLPGDLTAFESRTVMTFSGNRIDHIFKDSLYGLLRLEYLDFSFNRIASLQGDLFDQTPNLRAFDVAGNALTEIKFTGSKVLEFLRLFVANENRLDIFPEFFDKTPNLEAIGLRNNQIHGALSPSLLNSLSLLDLGQNQISEFPSLALAPNLKHLYLDQNQISRLSIQDLVAVRLQELFVNLANNRISELSAEEFAELAFIGSEKVNVTDNLIEEIPYLSSEVAEKIVSRKKFDLDLRGNPMSRFDLSDLMPICSACERLGETFADKYGDGRATLRLRKAPVSSEEIASFARVCRCKISIYNYVE